MSRYRDILIIAIGDKSNNNPNLVSTKLRKPKTDNLLETCEEVFVKLIADKNTKKLAGAQLISKGYERLFIDNLMWLCFSDMKVNELTYTCSLVFPGVFPFGNPVYSAVRALWYKLYL